MTARPELRVADRGSVPVAYLSGDVDVSVSASLRERLLRAVENQDVGLVVDLSDARYVDSAGINVLFELAERLKVRQLAFAIVVPEDGLIERVFALVDL
ncbi:MAG TPA: STAS domain-containing protein, partial [Thermoleophilaceae bacterium]|nr:STAS domain-containing protein [Thermoleophilaceae bacterium]